MNILFLTLIDFESIAEHNIYADLMREFYKNGHDIYVISPVEKRKKQETRIIRDELATILKLKIGNTQKTNIIEKGISTIRIEPIFIKGIKKYFADVKFDLVMYSTPPITFCKAVEFVKKRDNAKSYLLLKDIFPQNSLDMGMLRKSGLKGLIYSFFRKKEKKLYAISDKIGCMSQANVDFVIDNNIEIDKSIVEICPNCVEVMDMSCSNEIRDELRREYGIPLDKRVFVYGGNLGRPQGIDFLIECLENQKDNKEAYFLIVGDGTEYQKIKEYYDGRMNYETDSINMRLMQRLPKEDYDMMIGSCDVGLIFLDHRFTIPNFPSRLLAYMQAKLPVLACTDKNTDIGSIIVNGEFGWWCESKQVSGFKRIMDQIMALNDEELKGMGDKGFEYLCKEYSVEKAYSIIMKD